MKKENIDEKTIMHLMKEIEYGWLDINNQKHNDIDKSFSKNYKLQSPLEVINNKIGVCWDQVELERYYFQKTTYKIKTYFLVYYDNKKCPTHTFLVYKKNNKFYWFENSWIQYRGIHEYKTIKELLIDVKNKFIKSELSDQYNKENLILREYQNPNFGLDVNEFYHHCEQFSIIDL